MTYVFTEACVDLKAKSCMAQCPVDCIYEAGHALYINPLGSVPGRQGGRVQTS